MLDLKSPLLIPGTALVLLLSFTACGGGGDTKGTTSTNSVPNGTIVAPATSVIINPGQSVTFTGATTDPNNDPVTVLWDFGDGSTSTLLDPGAHTYAAVGTFTVTLTATDSLGLIDPTPATQTVTVQTAPVNGAPDATITAPATNVSITPGQSVAFSGTAADPNSNPVTVLWNFGDGTTSTLLAPGNHAYALAGIYTVTLTATDSLGLADPTPATRTITVQTTPVNNPPNGAITAPAANVTITAGQSVTFAGTATDPDGNPVTVLWNFGDGSATSTLLAPGSHPYPTAGTFTVTLTATDSLGLADPTPATRTITVNPVATAATLTQVQAAVFNSCTGCHSAGGSAGLNLTAGNAFSNLVNVPATQYPGMLRVVPGSPSTSALVTQLAGGHRSVSAANQALISSWITGGALNN
jgi:PKD repeat protein